MVERLEVADRVRVCTQVLKYIYIYSVHKKTKKWTY